MLLVAGFGQYPSVGERGRRRSLAGWLERLEWPRMAENAIFADRLIEKDTSQSAEQCSLAVREGNGTTGKGREGMTK